MITWLIGENSFEVHEKLREIERSFNGASEKVDAAELSLASLPDLLMGMSLFSTERLVIIRDITAHASLWEKLPDWLPRVNDDIHLVFVDTKPDKRTTSYKALAANAEVYDFPAWTERDSLKAEQWAGARAQAVGAKLDKSLVKHLVQRVGADQWQLAHALETLSLLDSVTKETIDEIIPSNPQENIFQLFETALEGKVSEVSRQLQTLTLQQDPYALLALLQSQVLSLAAVTFAGEDQTPTKDFAIHPFVASKLTRHAKKLGKARVAELLELFAQTDADMKRSKAEPWLLIEKTLITVAQ